MNLSLELSSLDKLPAIVKEIHMAYSNQNCFLFIGEMGAGKTTLITSFCKYLGVKSEISSPTYAIVNEYETDNKKIIYHFDLFRIKEEEELLDIGFLEYLDDQDAIKMIEWPQIGNSFYEDYVKVAIQLEENGSRRINLSIHKTT